MNGHERPTNGGHDRLATALGVFSLGLGLAEIAAPGAVGRMLGMSTADRVRSRAILRGFGMRELANGLGLVRGGNPSAWLWSRVAGDVMDLAFLGRSFRARGSEPARLSVATAAVAAVTALDVVAARRRPRLPEGMPHAPAVRQAVITINKSPAEVYELWRRLTNLPRFMPHLAAVEETGECSSHWVIEAFGTTVEWDAEIVDDTPNERIAWRAVENADVPNEGQVAFTAAPGGRGTEVRVTMCYEPPAGKIGSLFAKLLGKDPAQMLHADLRRLKQLLETGEIATTAGQSKGTRSVIGRALEPIENAWRQRPPLSKSRHFVRLGAEGHLAQSRRRYRARSHDLTPGWPVAGPRG